MQRDLDSASQLAKFKPDKLAVMTIHLMPLNQ
jgi:hypothetical protein